MPACILSPQNSNFRGLGSYVLEFPRSQSLETPAIDSAGTVTLWTSTALSDDVGETEDVDNGMHLPKLRTGQGGGLGTLLL